MKHLGSIFSIKDKDQVYWYNFANILSYVLVLFSVIFVFPLDLIFFGQIKYIESIGHFLFPILSFGLAQAFVNFTPLLESYHIKTFFGNSIVLVLITSIIAFILLLVFNHFYPSPNFYLSGLSILVGMGLAYIEIFKSKSLFLKNVTLAVFLEKLVPKILLILLFYWIYRNTAINRSSLLLIYSLVFLVISGAILRNILRFTSPRVSFGELYFFENISKKQLFKYSCYSLLGSIGSYLAFRIDGFLIPQYLTMQHNGVFGIAYLLAGAIAIPSTGIIALNINAISELIHKKDYDKLGLLYLESAKQAYFYCSFITILILISIPYIASLDNFTFHTVANFKPTLVVLCIGILFNISTGFNTEIINYSKYIKFNLFFVLLLSVLNVLLTIWFLKHTHLGILGVAISASLSLIVYNLTKLFFVKVKFNILPFDTRYWILILATVILGLTLVYLPSFQNGAITLLFKIVIAAILYYFFRKYIVLKTKIRKEVEYY